MELKFIARYPMFIFLSHQLTKYGEGHCSRYFPLTAKILVHYKWAIWCPALRDRRKRSPAREGPDRESSLNLFTIEPEDRIFPIRWAPVPFWLLRPEKLAHSLPCGTANAEIKGQRPQLTPDYSVYPWENKNQQLGHAPQVLIEAEDDASSEWSHCFCRQRQEAWGETRAKILEGKR